MASRILSLRRRLISVSISPLSQLLQTPRTNSQIPCFSSTLFMSYNSETEGFKTFQRSFSWWGYGRKTEPSATYNLKEEEEEKEEEVAEDVNFAVPESQKDVEDLGGSVLDNPGNGVEGNIALESAMGWYTPVDGVIAFLDGIHNFTGLPWWLTIVASTLFIRLVILPMTIVSLKKTHKISEILPKLPPPIAMGSVRSFHEQYTLFTQQKRSMGCPTFLWFFAPAAVQIPSFICFLLAVRRMCLEHHSGFDSGGAIWFVDLTEYVHDPVAALLPIFIAGMHFLNVQISFHHLKDAKLSGVVALLAKYYKIWLEILTVPIFLTGFHVPQGSLVYWLSNNVFTATQQLSLKHPSIHQKLGLSQRQKKPELVRPISEQGNGKSMDLLSSEQLLGLAAQQVAGGRDDDALQLLRAAVEKDPEKAQIYIAFGSIHLKKKLWVEATENFKLAISKGENDEVLIAAHVGAAFALIPQEKQSEAIAHLRKLRAIEEPNEPWAKHRYYQGLYTLGSALLNSAEKVEAANCLRLAAKYDPSLNSVLQEHGLDVRPGQQ